MKIFLGYRERPPENYLKEGRANAPSVAQFEGVVFSDGTVCVRWCTEHRSASLWSSFDEFYAVHGHPEYGTKIVWVYPTDAVVVPVL